MLRRAMATVVRITIAMITAGMKFVWQRLRRSIWVVTLTAAIATAMPNITVVPARIMMFADMVAMTAHVIMAARMQSGTD